MAQEKAVAVYRERLMQVGRVLELYRDRIEVRANWMFGGSYRQTIRLDRLRPQTREFWVRQRFFKRALMIGSLAAATAVVFTRPGVGSLPKWLEMGLWVVAVACGIMTVMSFRKVRFVRFMGRDEKPGLDIAKAGPDADKCEEFVEQIKRQIRKA